GANQIGNIQFIIDDEAQLKNEARDKAIAQAKDKAQQIAKSVGLTLGRIVSFSENDGTAIYPQSLYMDKGISAGGGGAAPAVEQGSQEIDISVTLGFELK
ncbi:MAG: SIMPL domain-containing protein, partial [Candidatus Parcubacteria bacterium]|nr:SIMPL domain-containing protein [Candidatus Parcubacteria bacterium]